MRLPRVLGPELKFIGRGGPQMQQVAGAQFKEPGSVMQRFPRFMGKSEEMGTAIFGSNSVRRSMKFRKANQTQLF